MSVALSAAVAAEREKVNKYAARVNQQGAEFLGLGFETTGAFGPGVLKLIERLSARADERGAQSLDADACTWTARRWSTRFRQLLSLSVVAGAARAVIEGALRLHDHMRPPPPPDPNPGWAARLPPGGALLLEAIRLGSLPQAGAHVAHAGGGPPVTAQQPLAVDDGGAVASGERRVRFATGV